MFIPHNSKSFCIKLYNFTVPFGRISQIIPFFLAGFSQIIPFLLAIFSDFLPFFYAVSCGSSQKYSRRKPAVLVGKCDDCRS